jgi:hypothetical protein
VSEKKTKANSDANTTNTSQQTKANNATSSVLVPYVRHSATNAKANTCAKLCKDNANCQDSAAKSFCKWDQERPTCFALYWTDQYHERICHVVDQSCPQVHPVECGIIDDSKAGVIETVDFLIDVGYKKNSCRGLCELTRKCSRSHCLDNLNFPVCANIYWADGRIAQQALVYETDIKKAKRDGRVPVECGVIQYLHKTNRPPRTQRTTLPQAKQLPEMKRVISQHPSQDGQPRGKAETPVQMQEIPIRAPAPDPASAPVHTVTPAVRRVLPSTTTPVPEPETDTETETVAVDEAETVDEDRIAWDPRPMEERSDEGNEEQTSE